MLLAERLPIKTYTVADGLLRDGVYKIKQDSRGFLWFCTAEGISRFDGYAFTNFTTSDGLPERHVNDFLETKKGEIWIATDGGLAKLNPTGLAGSKDNPLFTVILTDNSKAKSFEVLFIFIYDVPDKLTDLLTDQPLSVSWLKSPSELCKIKNL